MVNIQKDNGIQIKIKKWRLPKNERAYAHPTFNKK